MKELTTKKRIYEAPQMAVATVKTEQGYANSQLGLLALSIQICNEGKGSKFLENRTDGGDWGGSDVWQ